MPSASSRAAALLALAGVAAAPAPLRFDQAFAVAAAPASFHAQVRYRGPDGVHRLELWRSGEARLRRDTDGRLTTVALHRPGDPAYHLTVLDKARRIQTVVDRDSLYRVGRFTDWRDLAYGLRVPAGAYQVQRLNGAPPTPLAPAAPCDWYALASEGRTTRICWSRRVAYPLLIVDGAGTLVWRVTSLDLAPPTPALFRPDTTGYIRNDARSDISGD